MEQLEKYKIALREIRTQALDNIDGAIESRGSDTRWSCIIDIVDRVLGEDAA